MAVPAQNLPRLVPWLDAGRSYLLVSAPSYLLHFFALAAKLASFHRVRLLECLALANFPAGIFCPLGTPSALCSFPLFSGLILMAI